MTARPAARIASATPGRSLLPIGLALCLSLLPMTATASHAAGTAWTIDDIVRTETVDDVAVSPDGHSVAWIRSTVETVDKVEKRVDNLWLTRLDPAGGTPSSTQMTRGRDRMAGPRFAPDGHAVAFLSERKAPGAEKDDEAEGNQVWIIPTGGGEAFAATRLDRPVRAFGWIDGETLVVAAQEAKSAWELERKKHHDEAQVVDDADHEPPVRLYRVAAEPAARSPALTDNEDWIDRWPSPPTAAGRW